MKILLTAIAGPAGICFAKSLREIDGLSLVGINAEKDNFSRPLIDSFHLVPFANDPSYLHVLQRIIKAEGVDYVIPLLDDELPVIGAAADTLGCKVLISPQETILCTHDKRRTYDLLIDYLPTLLEKKDINSYPIFAKPRVGRGGRGAQKISNKNELVDLSSELYILQELLSPPEITVDALFDFNGILRTAVPRKRIEINGGISTVGEVFIDTSLIDIVRSIGTRMVFVGPINFQFMYRTGGYVLTEINARSSGGMGITIQAGVDIPKLTYELITTGEIARAPNPSPGIYKNFSEVIRRQEYKKETEVL